MAYADLPAEVRDAAERMLTRKQLTVFKLWSNGLGTARIGIMLDISEPVARRTRDRAMQIVRLHTQRKDVA